MLNFQKITADVTTVNKGSAIRLDETPLMGGKGRKAILHCPVLPLTSTVKIQGAPFIDADTGVAPVAGSSLWTDIATFTSSSEQEQEIEIPELIRYSTTVLDADGPNVLFYVKGRP